MFYKRNLTVEDMTKDRVEINFLAVVVDEQGANPPYQVTWSVITDHWAVRDIPEEE